LEQCRLIKMLEGNEGYLNANRVISIENEVASIEK
jgi:hypothetical protein